MGYFFVILFFNWYFGQVIVDILIDGVGGQVYVEGDLVVVGSECFKVGVNFVGYIVGFGGVICFYKDDVYYVVLYEMIV